MTTIIFTLSWGRIIISRFFPSFSQYLSSILCSQNLHRCTRYYVDKEKIVLSHPHHNTLKTLSVFVEAKRWKIMEAEAMQEKRKKKLSSNQSLESRASLVALRRLIRL